MPSSRPATWNPVEYAREVAFRRMADVKVYDDLTLKSKAIPASKDGKGIKVIGAGWSRTATLSMYAAMMELNYKCYHGMEMVITPGLADRWKEVLQRDLAKGNVDGVDWHHVLQGYDAGFDAPFAVSTFLSPLALQPVSCACCCVSAVVQTSPADQIIFAVYHVVAKMTGPIS